MVITCVDPVRLRALFYVVRVQSSRLEIVPAAKLFAANHAETADFAASADLFSAEHSLHRSRTAFAELVGRGRSPLCAVFSAKHCVELRSGGRSRSGERRAVFQRGLAGNQLLFQTDFCVAATQPK